MVGGFNRQSTIGNHQCLQRLLEGCGGVGRANVLIEVEYRKGRDHHHFGGKLRQELRHPADESAS